jgi:hypothetical protein
MALRLNAGAGGTAACAGQLDDKAVRDARHHQRGRIRPAAAATDVAHQRERAVPRPSEWHRDPIDRVLDQPQKPALDGMRHAATSIAGLHQPRVKTRVRARYRSASHH